MRHQFLFTSLAALFAAVCAQDQCETDICGGLEQSLCEEPCRWCSFGYCTNQEYCYESCSQVCFYPTCYSMSLYTGDCQQCSLGYCGGGTSNCAVSCDALDITDCAMSQVFGSCMWCSSLSYCIINTTQCIESCESLDYDVCTHTTACQWCSEVSYCTGASAVCNTTCEDLNSNECAASHSEGTCKWCNQLQYCTSSSNGCQTVCNALDLIACEVSSVSGECHWCSSLQYCDRGTHVCQSSCESLTHDLCAASQLSSICTWCTDLQYCSESSLCATSCVSLKSTACAVSSLSIICQWCTLQFCAPNDACESSCTTLDAAPCMISEESSVCIWCAALKYCDTNETTCHSQCTSLSETLCAESQRAESCKWCSEFHYCVSYNSTCETQCAALQQSACAVSQQSGFCQWCTNLSYCESGTHVCLTTCPALDGLACAVSESSAMPFCQWCKKLQYCDKYALGGCDSSCVDLEITLCNASGRAHVCQWCPLLSYCSSTVNSSRPCVSACTSLDQPTCQKSGPCHWCSNLEYCTNEADGASCQASCLNLTVAECDATPPNMCHWCQLQYCDDSSVSCRSSCGGLLKPQCHATSRCRWCSALEYCEAADVNCQSSCVALNQSACDVSEQSAVCGWCPLQYCANDGANNCLPSCSLLSNAACSASAHCQWCSELTYCDNSSSTCQQSCPMLSAQDQCLSALQCQWCGWYCGNRGSFGCSCFELLTDTACASAGRRVCHWCATGYCSDADSLCTCTAITNPVACAMKYTANQCLYDNTTDQCLFGPCFEFMLPNFYTQPYLMFILGLFKDVVVLWLLSFATPLLRRAQFRFKAIISKRSIPVIRVIELDQPLMVDGMQVGLRPYLKHVIMSYFDVDMITEEEDLQLLAACSQEGLWLQHKEVLDGEVAAKLPLPTNGFNAIVREKATQRALFLSSSTAAGRIAHTVDIFPGSFAIVVFLGGLISFVIVAVLDTLRSTPSENYTPFMRFQLGGFRVMNSGCIGTVSLIIVKYFFAWWHSRRVSHRFSGARTLTASIFKYTRTIHIVCCCYFLVVAPYLALALVGAVLYIWVILPLLFLAVVFFLLWTWLERRSEERTIKFVHVREEMSDAGSQKSLADPINEDEEGEVGGPAEVKWRHKRYLYLHAILRFLIEQELPTIVIAASLQASYNYAILYINRHQFGNLSYTGVVAVEYQSRSMTCLKDVLQGDIHEISLQLQQLCSVVPFC